VEPAAFLAGRADPMNRFKRERLEERQGRKTFESAIWGVKRALTGGLPSSLNTEGENNHNKNYCAEAGRISRRGKAKVVLQESSGQALSQSNELESGSRESTHFTHSIKAG